MPGAGGENESVVWQVIAAIQENSTIGYIATPITLASSVVTSGRPRMMDRIGHAISEVAREAVATSLACLVLIFQTAVFCVIRAFPLKK